MLSEVIRLTEGWWSRHQRWG